jgi:hypothetical protein
MKKLITPLILTLLALFSYAAMATTIHHNETDFKSYLGEVFIDDYDSVGYQFIQTDAQMSAVHNETKYTATGWPDTNLVSQPSILESHYYCAGCNGSFLLDFKSASLADEHGIFGVGINFKNIDVSDFDGSPVVDLPEYSAFVIFGDDVTENFILPSGPFAANHFWAITSERRIKTIHFGLWGGLSTQEGGFVLQDLTIGNKKTEVSEPSQLVLVCIGIVGLFIRRKIRGRVLIERIEAANSTVK